MTLYEINSQIDQLVEELFNSVDEETGEVSAELTEALDQLNLAKEEKLENIACFIKNLKAESAAIDEEIKTLKARLDAKENKIERMKEYLAYCMGDELKFETAKVSLSFRKSKAVEITDEENIPEAYIVIKTTSRVDKVAIKHAIDKGEEVPGASLVDHKSLQIK